MTKFLLYIGGFRLPDGTASAVRCIENAKIFEELGLTVVFIGKTIKNSEESKNLWNTICGYDCLNTEKAKKFPLEHFTSKYNISDIAGIITYNYQINYLLPYFKIARNNNIPFISDNTEWYLREPGLGGLFRKFLTEYKMRVFNNKIKNHICSTRYIQNYYPKCNTLVLPYVVDTTDLKWKTPTESQRNPLIKRFIYAGSPGNNMRKDALDLLIDAFLGVKHNQLFEFNIVGVTQDDFLDVFPTYKDILDKNINIHFHKRVSHIEVISMTKSSDFTVLLRPDTIQCRVGFSTKIVDSISCGVPVITNDINKDLTLYLKNGTQCIVVDNDVTSMTNALDSVIDMSFEQIEKMKRECLEYNPFDYKKFIPATKDFLIEAGILKN